MDLQGEYSGVESVEENNVAIERIPHVDNSDVNDNGPCVNSDVDKSVTDENIEVASSPYNTIEEGGRMGQAGGSPPTTAQSTGGLTPPTSKGYGLKKWRRIRRDVIKDGTTSLDASKILKRGFSGSGNMVKPSRVPVEIRKHSEGSVESTSVARNAGDVDGFASASALDSNFAAGPGPAFAAGVDSDHSEDRSSKSSTAASAPKFRHDLPASLGSVRERNRAKNLSGKSMVQQGKTRVESIKKPRGERVKIQKENSHSSVESDLRSSNSIFMLGAFSSAGNGLKSAKSMSYYSGNSDGAHQSGQFSEEGQTGYPKENFEGVENISQDGSAAWEAEEEKGENHQFSADQDPLVKSIQALHSVQEALEKEVEKFGEIAKEPIVPITETQISNLTENVKSLEVTLEETRMKLKAKESRIAELEAALTSSKSPKAESATNRDLLADIPMEELESAFKQKIEAEIEYLAIVRTIQKLRVDLQSQLMLLTEQDVAGEQEVMLDKLSEAESKAALLKKQAEELEKACENIVGAEEVSKLRRGACKVASIFLLQLLLLFLVLSFFVLQLSPQDVVVPT